MILGTLNKDIGHQIENIVYLELLRRGYNINIGKSGRGTEVDFVAVSDLETEYYQVSSSVLDEKTLERELTSLNQIKDNHPKTGDGSLSYSPALTIRNLRVIITTER